MKPTMTKRRKLPVQRCCYNGCKGPIEPPSLVLCKLCMEELGPAFGAIQKTLDMAAEKAKTP